MTVEYAPKELRGGHISEDNGQGMAATRTCTQFACREFRNGVAVYPVLQGGRLCPRCGANYGADNAKEVW